MPDTTEQVLQQDSAQSEVPSFLTVNLGEAELLKIAPPGKEYQIRIEASEVKLTDKKKPFINHRASILNMPGTRPVYFATWGTAPGDDDAQIAASQSDMKEFALCFSYPDNNNIEPKRCVGLTGWVILGSEIYKGEEKNVVQKKVINQAGQESPLA